MRNVKLLRLNPSPELLAKHHPRRPSKATIGGAGLFTRMSPLEDTDSETNDERQKEHLHFDASSHA